MGRREPAVLGDSADREISRYHLCVYNGRYQFFLGRSQGSGSCTYQRMYIYIFCIYPSPLGSLPPQHLSLIPLSLLLFLLWALSKHPRSRYSFLCIVIFHLLYFRQPFFGILLCMSIYRLICKDIKQYPLTAIRNSRHLSSSRKLPRDQTRNILSKMTC